MTRYIAFDVETPNHYNNRMSAIGISVIEKERITEEFFSFINPEASFDYFNTKLTGISSVSVVNAPTFSELWPQIEPLLSSGILVAHNARFDMGVLRRCLNAYGISWYPEVKGLCTVLMGRKILPNVSHKLNNICNYYGIRLNHHRADSDSRACAELLLRYINDGAEPEYFIRTYRLR